jgi:NAD(P) transhydrogenase subunit beta
MNLIIDSTYLLAAVLFIFGLKLLGSPATARKGNILASIAMLIAVVITLLDREILNYRMILIGVVIGSAIGGIFAKKIRMTAMPQMVAVFNGFGGAASALIAISEFLNLYHKGDPIEYHVSLAIMLGTLVGLVTFSGSLIAFGKLQDILTTKPVTFPLQRTISLVLFLGVIAMTAYMVVGVPHLGVYIGLGVLSLIIGMLVVVRIGGADMPVVISLLNSYSGLAAAAAGFVLDNMMLIIGGSLVGSAGLILTSIMCKAMNRSLSNVMFGAFGAAVQGVVKIPGRDSDRPVRDVTAEDAAITLGYARSVIVVPGYGLAVAQAQHQVRELADLLEARGVNVSYAVHPVAGRMPGHMNVLLAEANIPYDKLYDLDQINDEFDRTDVAVVIGANDVVNLDARDLPDSPIYGMPILNVDHAQACIVLKRSMNTGFAGIDNELFYKEKTMMLFGDAKASVTKLVTAVKSL